MKTYPNVFAEFGYSQAEIDKKIEDTFQTIFFKPVDRLYYAYGDERGYMLDTGNNDARTEGMSYGMMMAVQMDRQDIFDKLWRFSYDFMLHRSGVYEGYFAWSVGPDGVHNYEGPAPDGEEYYAMALFFAGKRWGDREAPFDYSNQARTILRHCVHQAELVEGGDPMWDPENHYIKFIPEADFSDASYHLPQFYDLFALWADEEDRDFWKKAAAASREYLVKSCHPVTGMAPEYGAYDASPYFRGTKGGNFYSDAYRVAMNIGMEAAWCGKKADLSACVDRLQAFLSKNTKLGEYQTYAIDGTPLEEPAMHPNAIIATTAAGSLAAEGPCREEWVRNLWELPLRRGNRRYYDNCLHFFSLLMLAGKYKIYE